MYNPQDIAERIKSRAKEKHIAIKDLLSDCGLGVNAISQLAKGQTMAYTSLIKIADKLECSIDYLVGRTRIVEVIDLPNALAVAIVNRYCDNGSHFISLNEIVQPPQMSMKNYFIRNIHFNKIEEIYDKAKQYNNEIMSYEDYMGLFKECTFKILGYDASGYIVTPSNYKKLLGVYKIYTESFLI